MSEFELLDQIITYNQRSIILFPRAFSVSRSSHNIIIKLIILYYMGAGCTDQPLC